MPIPTSLSQVSSNAASNSPAGTDAIGNTLDDYLRAIQAITRLFYEDPKWINLGYTHTYVGATQFRVSGVDVTASYPVGRRVRAVGSSTGTIYGTVTVSSFSTDTTITVSWDSGSLANEALTVSAGDPASGFPTNIRNIFSGETTIASASTVDLGTATGNTVVISGTTTITAFGSTANVLSPLYFIRFTGALTLTHNGTSLILPGSANITTANGDACTALYLGSGNWKVLAYQNANGSPILINSGAATSGQALIANGSGGTSWGLALGAVVNIQFFTASGTYNKTTGANKALVFVVGGGGGGGGADGAASALGAGGGGGGGGIAVEYITSLNSSETVTVGTGGTGGSNTGGNGGTGNTSSFGTSPYLSATGGAGGTGSGSGGVVTVQSFTGGAGGAGSGGNLNGVGGDGDNGTVFFESTGANAMGRGGIGGGTLFGGGGRSGASFGTSAGAGGAAGNVYGGGGGGAGCGQNTTGAAGGAGADGCVMIIELA